MRAPFAVARRGLMAPLLGLLMALPLQPAQAAPAGPRIGITGAASPTDARFQTYIGALTEAGAVPVLLTYDAHVSADDLDGIVFAGGEDVDPAYYQEKPHPTARVNVARDKAEMSQADEALASGLPIFGICRGSQLLNVKLGGSLIQDIPSHVTGTVGHGAGAKHLVTWQPQTRLGRTVGMTGLTVNSYHHQAVKRLAPGLQVAAQSDDGVVEAWEAAPGGPLQGFIAGVQFHPEKPDFPSHDVRQRLFADFVAEARAFAARKLRPAVHPSQPNP